MADHISTGHAEPPTPVRRYGRPVFLDASVIADQRGDLWVVPSVGHVGGASWAHRRPYDGPSAHLADPLELDDATRAALLEGLYGIDEQTPPPADRWGKRCGSLMVAPKWVACVERR